MLSSKELLPADLIHAQSGGAGARASAGTAVQEEVTMVTIGTTPASTEQLAMLLTEFRLTMPQAGETAVDGCVRTAVATALARLQWACEAAAIEAEDIVTQAAEALCLG